uniref:HDC12293 n=1 Tax=Drosophila melanogaster TaxID=7227 RepID=Q6IKJ3_DROME|nr:TPA_inf: HDC12293 [Drosophila melanogaster]
MSRQQLQQQQQQQQQEQQQHLQQEQLQQPPHNAVTKEDIPRCSCILWLLEAGFKVVKSSPRQDGKSMPTDKSFAGQVVRKFATSGHPLHRKSANNTTNGFIYLRLLCDVARNFLPPGGNRRQLRKIRCVGIEFFGGVWLRSGAPQIQKCAKFTLKRLPPPTSGNKKRKET